MFFFFKKKLEEMLNLFISSDSSDAFCEADSKHTTLWINVYGWMYLSSSVGSKKRMFTLLFEHSVVAVWHVCVNVPLNMSAGRGDDITGKHSPICSHTIKTCLCAISTRACFFPTRKLLVTVALLSWSRVSPIGRLEDDLNKKMGGILEFVLFPFHSR